jgi:hypothetical protein
MKNEFKIVNGIVYTSIVRRNGDKFTFTVDEGDLPLLQSYSSWCVAIRSTNVYVVNNKAQQLHRLLMYSMSNIEVVDHKDGNGLNNRRNNLRILSDNGDNMQNMKISRRNTSGERGVSYDSKKKKWVASVEHKGVKHFRRFNNKEDAIEMVREIRKSVMQYSLN